jgi:hypothetical protein
MREIAARLRSASEQAAEIAGRLRSHPNLEAARCWPDVVAIASSLAMYADTSDAIANAAGEPAAAPPSIELGDLLGPGVQGTAL